ncbi:MAG: hypothetical protein WKF92_04165 [Pyrinomonadaceae bacterium]
MNQGRLLFTAAKLFIALCLVGIPVVVVAQNRDYTAVYRFYNSTENRHLYTSDCSEKDNVLRNGGYNYEGVVFYVSKTQKRRTVPLHRLYLNNGAHFYTADVTEKDVVAGNPGNRYEGIVGYVSESKQRNTVPLYRMLSGDRHFYTTKEQEKNRYLQNPGSRLEGINAYVWTSGSDTCGGGGTQPPAEGNFPVIYSQANYSGSAMAVERYWSGNGDWNGSPHRIRSIRVPAGWRLTLYTQPNFRGTETSVTSDISWNSGAYWNGKTRSIRVSRDTDSGITGFPIIYAQANMRGPSEAIENGYSGGGDWEGSPHRIRSIRVPQGWFLVVYDQRNYRGRSYNVDADWTPQPGDYWFGRIRSVKAYRGNPPIQPR